MGSRYEVEVKIESAKNLKNVNWRHGPNRPYAVVWVDPKNKCSTRVDDSGDTEAFWDETLRLPLPPGPIDDFTLYVDVVHAGSEEDTKPLIGSAKLKLNDVGIGDRVSKNLTLKRPSGRPHGKVDVSVCVRDIGYPAPGAYHASPYGVPPPASGSRDYQPSYGGAYAGSPPYAAAPAGYPYSAQPTGYGYGQPQTAGYGYGQGGQAGYGYGQGGQAGYGYGQVGQGGYVGEEKKKSKFGGMGTGLAVGAVAGALGGLALAEGFDALEDHVADEAAERVEDDLGGGDDFGGDDF